MIDADVKNMIAEQYERAKKLLTEQRDGHARLAQILIEREVIFAEDVEQIFGKRPWTSRTEELEAENNQSQTTGNEGSQQPADTAQTETPANEDAAPAIQQPNTEKSE